MGALKPHKIPKGDLKSVQAIYDKVEGREERYELNLYITGEDEEPTAAPRGGGRLADPGAGGDGEPTTAAREPRRERHQ